ncbi:hypothetical protein HYPSUDRAFT_54228 [Hypholoma sublateritium FD-334 SS-4]|uniref:DNA polymerase delta subunit 4 n=1 Tax=Hypholoma sublateritium (strain FD-334 SS-4) TaxID=945553 RepID=A0A0D2L8D6_HYPSF|nr:hypothetical protein HYPSUDRAFT_54228 [Hypholoma sublateritium FD-334 SS-4]
MSSSNIKQTRLDFSVSKRTASNGGKLAKTTPRPVAVLPKRVPPAQGNTVEEDDQERSLGEITVISSDSDDDSELIEPLTDDTDARISKPTAKEASTSDGGRATRAASKKGVQAISVTVKAQQDASTAIENTDVFRLSNSRPGATTPKLQPQEAVVPSAERKESLPELKVKDPRWKKYHTEIKKKTGDMPPIHGEAQNKIHEILRIFDTSYEYGPCVGVSRLERWNRAKALGLNPPKEVGDILTTKQGIATPDYSQSVFFGEV